MPRPTSCAAQRRQLDCTRAGVRCLWSNPDRRCRNRNPCAILQASLPAGSSALRRACRAQPGCSWRRWTSRARREGCYEDPENPVPPAQGGPAPPRRAVVFSLFWGGARGRGYRNQQHRLGHYQYGLWRAIESARASGWWVLLYHDGGAALARILQRFRQQYPDDVLRCIRVSVRSPHLQGPQRYLGCVWRLLAADRLDIDVFISRDLDDYLDPDGLREVDRQWLGRRAPARAHVQAEPYTTIRQGPHKPMYNLGWFGLRTTLRHGEAPLRCASVADAIREVGRRNGPGAFDHYTSDEDFLTDVLLSTGPHGCWPRHPPTALQPIPSASAGLRRAVTSGTVPAAYRRFMARRLARHDPTIGRDELLVL